ncbi:coiled-coil-helix-coiled-coil-helix domain-containing protein 7 [Microcaecilia unicolor]|uniref:Coiled-coil-helix-coiled-coil-helix domain-containing protein 7 n=1 Tax=Microcaecilia unicolor TaxID=1415580 RepID=A0A6P7X0J2_9AMPH|nr:coiled-coil-helix-coiled-coil-helix domain-containing protein 7 [Microcaecilia unicolor]XP_030046013.1 coiled-coil-helix-coiled-coil-helix domain-containing protein 7 [Microcaecilia unicolor]
MSKMRDQDFNPCLEETNASRKCMDENNYKKEMCTTHFLRYKKCRGFWHTVVMQRRRDGVKPDMPTAAERVKILEALGQIPY